MVVFALLSIVIETDVNEILSDIVNVPDIKTVSRNAEKEYSGASPPSILLIPIFRLPVAVS